MCGNHDGGRERSIYLRGYDVSVKITAAQTSFERKLSFDNVVATTAVRATSPPSRRRYRRPRVLFRFSGRSRAINTRRRRPRRSPRRRRRRSDLPTVAITIVPPPVRPPSEHNVREKIVFARAPRARTLSLSSTYIRVHHATDRTSVFRAATDKNTSHSSPDQHRIRLPPRPRPILWRWPCGFRADNGRRRARGSTAGKSKQTALAQGLT